MEYGTWSGVGCRDLYLYARLFLYNIFISNILQYTAGILQ